MWKRQIHEPEKPYSLARKAKLLLLQCKIILQNSCPIQNTYVLAGGWKFYRNLAEKSPNLAPPPQGGPRGRA